MTTPQDPEDEPAGDDLPDKIPDGVPDGVPEGVPDKIPDGVSEEVPDAVPDPVSAEDALWRAIVDNYGERPEIVEPEIEDPPAAQLAQNPGQSPGQPSGQPRGEEDSGEPPVPAGLEDHYVPPVPPPLPKPPPARLVAWVGLFGVPIFVLVALVARLALPSWLGLVLMVWFVGGFVFLVASMRPGPGEDYDDGARL